MKRTVRVGLLGVLCAVVATASAQRNIYVNGTTGNDKWTGLCREWNGGDCGPKKTIQAGVDVTKDRDTVLVADGTYAGPGNVKISLRGRAITLRSENGPENCIVNCGLAKKIPGFEINMGEGRDTVLEGFTITNAEAC